MEIISQKRFINEALKAHNEYRAKHQVPNLELDSKLSEFACEWSEKLALEGSLKYEDGQYLNEPIGENILRVKLTKKLYFSGEEATEEWYKGSAGYNYDGEFTEAIGNFTQIVWKNSKKVGFGFTATEDGYFYAVANYYPAGNYRNKFNANVFPVADDISSWFEYFRLFESFKNEPQPKITEKTVKIEPRLPVSTPKMVFNEAVNEFGPVQNKFIMEALKTHNDCRARHGVAPLKHNREISKIAQAYALKLARLKALKHSPKESRIFNAESLGENLAFSYDSRLDFYSGEKASMQWYDEIKDHHFDLDSQPGTGHFTQLVWKNSKEVGFGVAKANDGSFYAVANYFPAGNMIGRFVPNVPRPVN